VTSAVTEGWRLNVRSVAYVPKGGGSHHWKVADGQAYFVTVDDLDEKVWLGTTRDDAFDGLRRALTVSAVLRDGAGLPFVVSPVESASCTLVHRIDDRYALSVYPFLVGSSYPFGPRLYPDVRLRHRVRSQLRRPRATPWRRGVLDMLVALHQATPTVAHIAPQHEPTVLHREYLDAFLHDPSTTWDTGPFGPSAYAQLRAHTTQLADVVAGYDRLVASTTTAPRDMVVTHGEPHPGNVMSTCGRLVLFDWDTVALAPPERDLSMVIEEGTEAAARYEAATGHRVDPTMMTLYRLRWYLDELATAVRWFSRPHERTGDALRVWQALAPRLTSLEAWHARIA